MNTNSNTYTVVYSAIIVIVVASILALAATSLKDRQVANMKAETISQILSAAKIPAGESNAEIIATYKNEIAEAFKVDLTGKRTGDLDTEDAEIFTTSDLKAQNYNIADASEQTTIPVYVFKNGTKVHCYGYYTTVNNSKWYLVQSGKYTGYCNSKYLKKV